MEKFCLRISFWKGKTAKVKWLENEYTFTWTSLGLKVILLPNLSIWREMLQYIICVACVIYSIYFNSVIVKDEFIVVLRDFAGLSRPTFEPFGVSAFDFWIIYYLYSDSYFPVFFCFFHILFQDWFIEFL